MSEKKVLDKGFVRLIAVNGNEELIEACARVSYDGHEKQRTEEDRIKLLSYLLANGHTSPFEHASVTLHIKMPLFVQNHLVRHRTFKFNFQSFRYMDVSDKVEFYEPDFRKQATGNKQCSGDDLVELSVNSKEKLDGYSSRSVELYSSLIKDGTSREQARMFLPQSIYSEGFITCDLHNLMHFLRLRCHNHSQWETRQYAKAIYGLVSPNFPITFDWFKKYSNSKLTMNL